MAHVAIVAFKLKSVACLLDELPNDVGQRGQLAPLPMLAMCGLGHRADAVLGG